MDYINDSITSITTKWLSQLLQKVEANKLWSWGEAEKSGKFKIQYKNKIVVQIYWTHVRPCVHLRVPLFLGIVILSVRLSVRHARAFWRNYRIYCRNFNTIWKGNHSSLLRLTEVGDVPLRLKFALKLTHPLWKASTSMLIMSEL